MKRRVTTVDLHPAGFRVDGTPVANNAGKQELSEECDRRGLVNVGDRAKLYKRLVEATTEVSQLCSYSFR
jgi:hypothetical protein